MLRFCKFKGEDLLITSLMKGQHGRILRANLSWTRKKSNSSYAKKNFVCGVYTTYVFLHLKPDFKYYSSLNFVR